MVQSWRVGGAATAVDGAVAVCVARKRLQGEVIGDLVIRIMMIKRRTGRDQDAFVVDDMVDDKIATRLVVDRTDLSKDSVT